MDEAAHLGLVVFVRTENVIIFETDDLVEETAALGEEVEEVLGVAIHVEGTQAVEGVAFEAVVHAL
jgi:hypothetical protein